MLSCLPINIEDLLHFQGIESTRVELKASWDEVTVGPQVVRTICAFANDFQNLNGGYIVIGVGQESGSAVLPPKGLDADEIELAQNWIRGKCNTIDDVYQPVFSPETVNGKHILVIWAPGSAVRPHQAYDKYGKNEKDRQRRYYIRIGDGTMDAASEPELLTQLMQLTARVPFDDRRAQNASVLDLRETKVREFLQDVRSDLVHEQDTKTLYRNLRIAVPVNGHDLPKNVGLLFFSQDPEQWFPGARIEVVHFSDDAGGNIQEEKIFSKRPIHEQLRDCLAYLENMTVRQIEKLPNRPTATGWVNYPILALREAVVNAVYHRSYEYPPEPTKVYLYPDRMEIISYPGPVAGIEQRHFDNQERLPAVPARNRRIGEFLKELRLAEGRGTGIPKVLRVMRENGSPQPKFDFDETRTYFRVTLPAHPEYVAVLAIQDAARLRVIGDIAGAVNRLKNAQAEMPSSPALALELVKEYVQQGDLHQARELLDRFVAGNPTTNPAPLITVVASGYLDAGRRDDAMKLLDSLSNNLNSVQEAFDAAIQEKRAERYEKAHTYFSIAGDAVMRDVRALHEFAQTKIALAKNAIKRKNPDWITNKKLLGEAREMLQRVTQMEAPLTRHAWAWFNLGQVLKWLKAPQAEIRKAFEEAYQLAPNEQRFKRELDLI